MTRDDLFGGSSSASSHHAPRRWRALPRWGRRSVRVPRLSEHARLVVLAIVVGGLTGWGAVAFLLLIAGSVWVSHRLSRFSIYTLKLHRRGVPAPGQEEAEPAGG